MTEAEFRATLAAIYADQRRKAETEAAIERQLAAAWFLHHPEEAVMPSAGLTDEAFHSLATRTCRSLFQSKTSHEPKVGKT
jgi:hypothetical protein